MIFLGNYTQEYKTLKKKIGRLLFKIGRSVGGLKVDVQGQGDGKMLDVDWQGGERSSKLDNCVNTMLMPSQRTLSI